MICGAFAFALFAAACDAGKRHEQHTLGPAVTIIGTNIDAAGNIPSDGVLQVSFDRYMLPSTLVRQGFVITDNTNQPMNGVPLETAYDPIARTVTISGPDGVGKPWLTPDQSYKLFLPVASDGPSNADGFRAIDRAPLWQAQNREIVFRAGPPTGRTTYEPAVDFCADVFPIFAMKCNGSLCHGAGADTQAASLILGSADGVRVTAIGRAAQAANTTARAYTSIDAPEIFGLNMELIKPGDPGESWLLYKVELAREPVVDASIPDAAPQKVLCTPPPSAPAIPGPAVAFKALAPVGVRDETELSVLSDYVLGREMPYPSIGPVDVTNQALSFQERELIRIWIARGADTRECGGCGLVEK